HLESAGIFDQRYVHYRAAFDLSAAELEKPPGLLIHADGGGDCLTVRINGSQTICSKYGYINLDQVAKAGSNTVEILFENLGCQNFGPVIEDLQGITQVSLIPRRETSHKAGDADPAGRALDHLAV